MNDKKKLLVMIVLGVAVLGIGAFQFVNMSGSEPPKTAQKEKPKEETTATQETTPAEGEELKPESTVANLYQLGMNARDPFQEGVLPLAEGMTPPANPTPSNPAPAKTHRPPRGGSGRFQIPQGISGTLPGPMQVSGPGTNLQPSTPLRQPGDFEVTGVITGARPAAVFVDATGKQRLVTVGSALDGDSRLVSVEKGKVTIEHKGKTKTINVGGTPNVK